jgi:hypothetical protein
MRSNEKREVSKKQTQTQEHAAARTIQDAWRRESSKRTSQVSHEGVDKSGQEEKAEHATIQATADSGFVASSSIDKVQDTFKPVDDTASKRVIFSLDNTTARDAAFDDDESSVSSQEHLCLSSPTSTKRISFDHHEYRHFRSMHFVVLLITALVVVALGLALTQPNDSSIASKVLSVNFPDHLSGFHLDQSDQQSNILVDESTKTKHRIEWQSLPLHFGAK